jgi:hypothetical protein
LLIQLFIYKLRWQLQFSAEFNEYLIVPTSIGLAVTSIIYAFMQVPHLSPLQQEGEKLDTLEEGKTGDKLKPRCIVLK